MTKTRGRRLLALAVPLACLHAGSASAVELVVGGYASEPAGAPAEAPGDAATGWAMAEGGSGASLTLGFTPRGSGPVGPERAGAGAPRLRFELGLSADAAGRGWGGGDAAAGAGRPSWLAEDDAASGPSRLSVGGALRWSEWSLGGGLARTNGLLLGGGGDADLVSATVGYGAWSASLAYGEAERPGASALDVLMLSTDFAGWSWLSLGSEVAVGSDGEDEEVAVGRLGLRLNF